MERSTITRAGTPIVKPLPPEKFVDLQEGEAEPGDTTGDLAYNAEMRWEAMAGKGYLTPVGSFFVRSHAPTPSIDPASWTLRVERSGVEHPLELSYDDLSNMPQVSCVQALECAGNGRAFFEEVQGRQAEGTQWRLGAVGVAEWTGVPLREVLERAGLKESARGVMLESLDEVRMRRPLPVGKAVEDGTLLALGMNGGLLKPDHGFPLRAVVSGWAAVASVKWLGRIHVSETPLSSPWNTNRYVLTGGAFGADREPIEKRGVKSALELPWPARLPRAGTTCVAGRGRVTAPSPASSTRWMVVPGAGRGSSGRTSLGRGRGGASGGTRSRAGMRSGSGPRMMRATSSRTKWGGMI